MDGRYNLCEDVQFAGVSLFAEGALLKPLSVVLHAIQTSGITLGTPVLICGAGPIGLLALSAARASGAQPIMIADLEPGQLAFAQELVPSCRMFQVDIGSTPEESAKRIRRLFGDSESTQPRLSLECTGVESSVCTASFVIQRGGTVMVVGVGKSVMHNLPFMHLSLAQVSELLSQYVL